MPLFIQITVTERHYPKIQGISNLIEKIPARWRKEARLLFVMPEDSKLQIEN